MINLDIFFSYLIAFIKVLSKVGIQTVLGGWRVEVAPA